MPRQSRAHKEKVAFKERAINRQAAPMRRNIIQAYRQFIAGMIRELGLRKPRKKVTKRLGDPFDINVWINTFLLKNLPSIGDSYKSNLIDRETSINIGLSQNVKDDMTARYINRQTAQLSGFASDEAQRIRGKIASFISQGITGNDLYESIAGLSDALTTDRAKGLARNFTSTAFSDARSDFWETAAPDVAKTKSWLPSIGGRFDRVHHNRIPAINGKIPFESEFSWDAPGVGVVSAKYPNDSKLPPGERINCA